MDFTWRQSKRITNLKKHGFDFAQSEQVFNGPTITLEDSRDYYGEQRFNTTGFLGTTIVTHAIPKQKMALCDLQWVINFQFFAE